MPTVSVLVTTHNRAELMAEALEGVLAQTYTDWECVIVDDGSTDDTAAVAAQFQERDSRFRYAWHRSVADGRDQKVVAVRKFAARQVRGELIAFLDDDDVWLPNYLDAVVQPFGERAECVMACAARLFWNGHETLETQRFSALEMDNPLRGVVRFCFLVPSQCVIRQSAYDRTEGFRLLGSEDYDLWLQVMPLGATVLINAPLVKYRVHSGSSLLDPTGEKRRKLAHCHRDVLRKFLVRPDISLYDRLLAFGNLQRKQEQLLDFDLEDGTVPRSRLARLGKLLSIIPSPLLRNPALARRYLAGALRP